MGYPSAYGGSLFFSAQICKAELAALAGAVLEQNLPGISGISAAHTLRGQAADLPVAVLTAQDVEDWQGFEYLLPDMRCSKKFFRLHALETSPCLRFIGLHRA